MTDADNTLLELKWNFITKHRYSKQSNKEDENLVTFL